MKTVYIDSDFKCYSTPGDGLVAVDTSFFDDKCDAVMEGYRFVPAGQTWTRPDGAIFRGEMIAPWKDYRILQAYQEQYESTIVDSETIAKAAAYDILMEGASE